MLGAIGACFGFLVVLLATWAVTGNSGVATVVAAVALMGGLWWGLNRRTL